ncbi:MAG: DUF1847 domain-containing protein [Theionarchaea archaeon]|nr:MAG: hypothetical protein AYK18_11300 [Theionarchaea archaeon DG-70]MBU7009724.1 DUF1847 domain-containing protein [Theionarchaea archaeon]
MNCAECTTKECYQGKNCVSYRDEIKQKFTGTDLDILKAASLIESRYYKKKNRVEEIILFAKEMGYKKLGLAFCVGLSEEARKIQEILKDFDVVSVCCKVCGISKEEYNLEKIEGERYEASCNPMGQATVLNKENTELNIVVGLCVGHDVLFYKHSNAPVTTLAVKDRILAHNPLGAIYSAYYF